MKVIFLQDVPRVGKKHDVKEVNDGYAVNFLLPRKLAQAATPKAISELETRKKELLVEKEVREDLLIKNLEAIKDKVVVIKAKSDEKGSLFSSVHKKDIIEAMKGDHHAFIDEEFMVLEKPIKALGEFEIKVSIKNKNSSFKLRVEKI